MKKTHFLKVALIALVIGLITVATSPADQPPKYNVEDVVDIRDINYRILVKLAYSTTENFLYEDVYGDLQTCYLRKAAAEKLDKAQTLLEEKRKGYRLVVYDGLRPRNVQYKMWRLVKGTPQQEYVADPEKGSFHNFGAAVDLSVVDDEGSLLDMGTPFDYFGDLAQPRYEEQFLKEGKLTKKQIENRRLLREVMQEAGFQGIADEWWHFNAFSYDEVKSRYKIVEFFLPLSKMKEILKEVEGLKRDKNGFCVFVKGAERKLYLIEQNEIKLVFDSAVGEHGLGKTKEGDHKTPLGDYRIKWMVSKNGPKKNNPGGVSSLVVDGRTYAVLDTELYFGDLKKIRVKVLPDGTRKVSSDVNDRPITPLEIRIAQSERLWTDAYGGKNAYVMALDYPNPKDRAEGKTGSCIEIHASLKLENEGYKKYTGTLGCVSMYPDYAKRVYEYVNPGTPVRIVE
ncbi:MAG: M15 family metallopeptidase [Thermodesulfobacteriota bacterium]